MPASKSAAQLSAGKGNITWKEITLQSTSGKKQTDRKGSGGGSTLSIQDEQALERKRHNTLILVLAGMMTIGPFSTDMYLPGFLAIARGLETDIAHVGYSLTSYFIGVSLGQIAYGPLLDRYGRKKPLMLGFLVFTAASLGCVFSPTIHVLVVMRFFAGLGGCVGMVGSRAVVRDLFSGTEMARMLSLLMMVFSIAPIAAPTIGSFVVSALSWRYLFLTLAVIGFLIYVAIGRFLRETKGHDVSISLHPKNVVLEYVEVFRNRVFLTCGLAAAVSTAGFFAYIAGSAFIYMNIFGFTEIEFGLAYGANVVGLMFSNQGNRIALKRYSPSQVLWAVTVVQFFLGILLVASVFAGFTGRAVVLSFIFVYLFCFGFIMANAVTLALEPFTRNAGTASALIGSLQMVAGALSSGLVSYLHDGTMMPMISIMAGCTGLSLLLLSGPAFARLMRLGHRNR